MPLSRRPVDVPLDDDAAFRQWTAERFVAMLTADIEELGQLERLQHHLQAFEAIVWGCQCGP